MYSDNRWDLVTAARVYPQAKTVETLVLVNPAEPFASPLVVEWHAVNVLNPKAAHKPGASPLVKPQAYKNRSR
jgi:hypothetical protein